MDLLACGWFWPLQDFLHYLFSALLYLGAWISEVLLLFFSLLCNQNGNEKIYVSLFYNRFSFKGFLIYLKVLDFGGKPNFQAIELCFIIRSYFKSKLL